jgi:uncharacterized protein (DUF1778 family)
MTEDATMESPERTAWLPSIRAYPWERDLLLRAAQAEQVKVSEYIRRVLVDAARRRLAKAERA